MTEGGGTGGCFTSWGTAEITLESLHHIDCCRRLGTGDWGDGRMGDGRMGDGRMGVGDGRRGRQVLRSLGREAGEPEGPGSRRARVKVLHTALKSF